MEAHAQTRLRAGLWGAFGASRADPALTLRCHLRRLEDSIKPLTLGVGPWENQGL